MSETVNPYRHPNSYYIHRQIKRLISDESAGKLTREDCAIALRSLADKLEERVPVSQQMTLDEVQEHVQKHLGREPLPTKMGVTKGYAP